MPSRSRNSALILVLASTACVSLPSAPNRALEVGDSIEVHLLQTVQKPCVSLPMPGAFALISLSDIPKSAIREQFIFKDTRSVWSEQPTAPIDEYGCKIIRLNYVGREFEMSIADTLARGRAAVLINLEAWPKVFSDPVQLRKDLRTFQEIRSGEPPKYSDTPPTVARSILIRRVAPDKPEHPPQLWEFVQLPRTTFSVVEEDTREEYEIFCDCPLPIIS
jgi:hypothetical protein